MFKFSGKLATGKRITFKSLQPKFMDALKEFGNQVVGTEGLGADAEIVALSARGVAAKNAGLVIADAPAPKKKKAEKKK